MNPMRSPRKAPSSAAPVEPRGARRKRETRERLLDAAFRLMAERGMDAVAINEITEAANVGFGSFYNHFESKEAIYSAVMDIVFESFADALDVLVDDLEDPAEIIAVSVRHTLLRARREPLWGRFLIREGLSARGLSRGLATRLRRDIQKGIASHRFDIPDPFMSFIAAGGAVLGAIVAELEAGSESDIPERAATVLLHGLGLPFDEAKEIAHRPLPPPRPVNAAAGNRPVAEGT
jgi:AcrR family transcriptional regulator